MTPKDFDMDYERGSCKGFVRAGMVVVVVVILAWLCWGCASLGPLVEKGMAELDRQAKKWEEKQNKLPPVEDDPQAAGGLQTGLDAVEYDKLQWLYGGFDGKNAKWDRVTLADFRCDGRSVYYRWAQGLDVWGIPHTEAGGAIFAVFYLRDGKWVGGKMDWVSTSRASRELKHTDVNSKDGAYGTWKQAGFTLPVRGEIVAVVVSANGARRSNVVVAASGR